MPDQRLYSLLFSIEQATVAIGRKFPSLVDKEVEAVYDQYRNYFREVQGGRELPEPTSTIAKKEELLNEIWEVLLFREDQGIDLVLLDGSFGPAGRPIRKLEELYVMAFNEVRKSCRLWRKQAGPKGYLKHIEAHIGEVLGGDHNFPHPPIE